MTTIPYPIATSLLSSFLPHRAPMVWVDEVISADDIGGVCRVKYDPTALYCDESGNIRPSSFVEWMAQGFGFVKASRVYSGALAIDQIPKETFLAQMRHVEFPNDVQTSAHFDIDVRVLKVLGPLTLVKGVVYDDSKKIVATAELKLFAQ